LERDTARVQQARALYQQRLTALDLRRLRFVDESGVNLAMTRRYGRAPKGARVVGSVPQNSGRNVTMLGALDSAITSVLPTVTETDARGWFRHCGYALH
jgi:hypothetical protein